VNAEKCWAETRTSFRKGLRKISRTWEENPLLVIAAFGAAAGGTAKLLDSVASFQSKRAYARQVRQKEKHHG